MHEEAIRPMTAENVEEFDVRVFDSRDLVVSIVPIRVPWATTAESYELSQSTE